MWTQKDSEVCTSKNFRLCSEDEGRMLFFPATLQHQVYPFYECEEERVTISGNIVLYDPEYRKNLQKQKEIPVGKNEEKKKMVEAMENSIKRMKEEVEWMKKEGEKGGSI